MKWRSQPTKNSCGQTCIAMILDVDPNKIVDEYHDGPTWGTELVSILKDYGVNTAPTCKRFGSRTPPPPPVPLAIVGVVYEKRKDPLGHWVLWDGEKYLDPARSALDPDKMHHSSRRLTSYIAIYT